MRQALRPNPARRPVAQAVSLPPPTGGWVSNKTISSMKPDTALVLRNWFPGTDSVSIRKGFKQHATTPETGSPVETVISYKSGTVSKLFACVNGNIFDVTSGNATVADVTGLTEDRWYWTHFATSGDQFVVACNGADATRNYDGASWTTPSITGVTPSADTLIYPFAYKERLFFCQKDTSDVWFLPVDSIAGAAQKLVLGGLLQFGGTIIAGTTWTLDAGFGPDDYAVFLSSEGEVLIYQGTDPATATEWELKGRFRIGRPIGRRCLMRVGGEVAILCSDGVTQLTRSLTLDRASTDRIALTWKIQSAFNLANDRWAANYGWQMINYPEAHMIIVNIPTSETTESQQYVMNTLNGSWCQFTNIHAFNWTGLDGDLYFGGAGGVVYQGHTTSSDDGAAIPDEMVTAFTDWGSPNVLKHAKMVRPVFAGEVSLTPALVVLADYIIHTPDATQSLLNSSFTTPFWDVDKWDEAVWPYLEDSIATNWGSLTGIGYKLAIGLNVHYEPETPTSEYEFRLNEMNCLYERGHFV